jgi:hypothetical protein
MIAFLLERPVMLIGIACLVWALFNMAYLFFWTKKTRKNVNILDLYIDKKLSKKYRSYRYNEMEL